MPISTMVAKALKSQTRAFTLLDSLLALMVTAFVVVSLTLSVGPIFARVEEQVFFLEFERTYLETQKLSATKGQKIALCLSADGVLAGTRRLTLPRSVTVEGFQEVIFDEEGGNSTLKKLVFLTADKEIRYQIYLGSGKYKKTESERLYSP